MYMPSLNGFTYVTDTTQKWYTQGKLLAEVHPITT